MDWGTLFNIILGNFGEFVGLALRLIVLGVAVIYVVPWLKEHKLYSLVKSLMAAAEAEFKEQGVGILKKEWVFEQLDEMGVKYNRTFLSKLIDGFTLELTAAGILNKKEVAG